MLVFVHRDRYTCVLSYVSRRFVIRTNMCLRPAHSLECFALSLGFYCISFNIQATTYQVLIKLVSLEACEACSSLLAGKCIHLVLEGTQTAMHSLYQL